MNLLAHGQVAWSESSLLRRAPVCPVVASGGGGGSGSQLPPSCRYLHTTTPTQSAEGGHARDSIPPHAATTRGCRSVGGGCGCVVQYVPITSPSPSPTLLRSLATWGLTFRLRPRPDVFACRRTYKFRASCSTFKFDFGWADWSRSRNAL